jgi:hypothetical protein
MNELDKHICICNTCLLASKNKVFVAKGKQTKGRNTEYVLQNNSGYTVDKIIVDDCLLKAKTRNEKCDYLFRVVDNSVVFLVECKGSDVLKAVSQIDSTLSLLQESLKGYVAKGRIVTTKTYSPDLKSISFKKLRARLNTHLETKNIKLEETI